MTLRRSWLRKQAAATVMELYANLMEADKDLPIGEKVNPDLLRVRSELERRNLLVRS